METRRKQLLFVFVASATLSIINRVISQNQQGFISLSCGLPSNESPYNEPSTNLTYISDSNFILGGKTGRIPKDFNFMKLYTTLRYFPDGIRNCHTLNVTQDTNYLIRTVFIYGNYDGLNSPPRFDLYLGPNLWTSIDLGKSGGSSPQEIIHITRSNILEICLVKTGTSTPTISAIELRPLRYDTYISQIGSLKNLLRYYFTTSHNDLAYPQDVHDRVWFPYMQLDWRQINTTRDVTDPFEKYNVPQDVITTAAIPANTSEPMILTWSLESSDDQTYAYIHVADIQQMRSNEIREFEIVANGNVKYGVYRPFNFRVHTVYNTVPFKCEAGVCRVQLTRTSRSNFPPLMNAIEVFSVIQFPQSETNQDDVIAMKNIKATYGLNRITWQGDPCVPKQFTWSGLRCNIIDTSTPPRIIALDLSSSGLSGVIPPSIQNLTLLQELDLSKNNLHGEVPEFLAKMKSLLVIDLSGNNLTGLVPRALLDRQKEGLKLIVDEHVKQCVSCKAKFPVKVVAATVSSVTIIVIVLLLIFIIKRRKTSSRKVTHPSLEMKNKIFSYTKVKEITNNFQVILGKGGFGVVYHGLLNNEQVAVKILSQSSTQGYKEFKTEVELLLRVHHVNLVSLIGYCDDGNNLALIYEFMENGNLKEHLSGKRGGSILDWSSRLRIAIEVALGIEYLHIGCKPPMVHRDVKCTNILLDKDLEAKLADFGLSRSFLKESKTHVSTNVAGTIGYLDPDYYQNNWLTEKSDVYSFGIVLLELITGQPVIDESREKSYIVEWSKSMIANGDIHNIVDPKLHGEYDTGSAWRTLELAMSCINACSVDRPNMTRIAHELNECLETYKKLRKIRNQDTNSTKSIGHSMSFNSEVPSAR